jgi:hypothetical protein
LALSCRSPAGSPRRPAAVQGYQRQSVYCRRALAGAAHPAQVAAEFHAQIDASGENSMRNHPLGIYEKALAKDLSWPERLVLAKSCGFDFVEMSVDETDERLSRLDWTPPSAPRW